jgi:glycerophosphoryl diester phosphodiesterase
MSPAFLGLRPNPFRAGILAGALPFALGMMAAAEVSAVELTGRAVLPAATFAKGPTSGQYLGSAPINGQAVPFVDKQPVQGFSAVLKNKGGSSYWVMADNGYGSLENSADFNLRMYNIRPSFKTAESGDGSIKLAGRIELHDPDRKIPFAITNHFTRSRVLTGADFDIESVRRAPDGTLWFGDEFGPFLLHTDAKGKVLEAPVALPDFDNPGHEIRSPQNPHYEEASAVRIMNAVRRHAQLHGNRKAPVFSPYSVMLKYDVTVDGVRYKSDPDAHYARGANTPAGLAPATSEVFDVKSIQSAGYPVVTWTVNSTQEMNNLLRAGVNGIISDSPDLLWEAVKNFDADNDGTPGDFIGADGLIDIAKFDAQAHRGGRNLRPENTLPAMEAGLDNLMTTLETDAGIARGGVPVLDHDPYIEAAKCRRADGSSYTRENQVLVKDLTAKQIQAAFICDKLLPDRPSQKNDRSLSPAAVAFAAKNGLADAYVKPTVQQLFDFVAFYGDYYKTGAGKGHPDAMLRWMNAEKVRFNIETKINPRSDKDAEQGRVYKDRTIGPNPFADKLAKVIAANRMEDRADIQSFDFRTLLRVQQKHPNIRTVYLFGDFPIYPDRTDPNSDDSTNLQDENGQNTPWLAGLYWPYRDTLLTTPAKAQRSGGFEGMAITPDGAKLLPLLEQPLTGDPANILKIYEFDLAGKRYTGVRYSYPLELNADGSNKGTNIGDFTLHGKTRGLVIERDNSQGRLDGFKAIFDIKLGEPDQPVAKTLAADLMDIADPRGISLPGEAGDVGLGATFAFPFTTIEDVVVLDRTHIGVLNDNNFPFSVGRHVGSGKPDDNEFIILKLDRALKKD